MLTYCKKCGTYKPQGAFSAHFCCKQCATVYKPQYRANKRVRQQAIALSMPTKPRKKSNHPANIAPGFKWCNKCKQTKPVANFDKSPVSKDGHKYICKHCATIINQELCKRYIKVPREILAAKYPSKFCSKCKQIKLRNGFGRNRCNKDGLVRNCKVCINSLNAQRRKLGK